ncbi:hypothetical protein RND71_019045 [Anisodus tanguticus]|uniref:Auxin-responsive protein n=1 Tax=Anisodus tanguticus TaxID=243964 RepID=A0AAE1VK02_9SOLA|nr:hypothetical protein RND71_019045 [Anisodus tanguticus]
MHDVKIVDLPLFMGFKLVNYQLEASTNQELNQRIPLFNLQPKILCRVLHIQLLAEQDTDEVYAKITLLPEADQVEPTSPDPSPPEPLRPKVHFFYKVVTASDTSTHGGFSIFRKHANECLPPLEKYVVFRSEKGEVRIGIIRLACQPSSMPQSVISSQNMHLGVLATASHAVATQTMFVNKSVYRRPKKYLEAVNHQYSVGMRFKMHFDGEEIPDKRFTGTIVGVQWDEPASVSRPDRVSPWDIEPFVASVASPLVQPMTVKNKRHRPNNETKASALHPQNSESRTICDTITSCRLFGVDLKNPSFGSDIEKPPLKPANISENTTAGDSEENSGLSRDSKDQKQDQLDLPPKEVHIKQICSTRSRTKVQMQGVAVGRAVDLTVLSGYDELVKELEEMFEIQEELHARNEWEIVFTDDEGDMMLMGDHPWQEFCNVVKRIFICSSQDMKSFSAGTKSPSLESETTASTYKFGRE